MQKTGVNLKKNVFLIKISVVALKKNSKIKGCLKRIPDGASGRNKHNLKALRS
mgnify:CR=1 FL=1